MEKTFVKMLEAFKSYAKDSTHEIDSDTASKWIDLGVAEKVDPVDNKLDSFEKSITASLEARDKNLIETISKAVAKNSDKVYATVRDDSDKSFGDFINNVKSGNREYIDKKYFSKSNNTSSGPTGGYLVPQEYLNTFFQVSPEKQIVRPRANCIDMHSNIVRQPTLDQSVNQYGGVILYYREEEQDLVEANMKVREVTLTSKDLIGYCLVSNDLLKFSQGMSDKIATQFRNAFLNREDKECLVGTGVNGPMGIYNSGAVLTVTRKTSSHINFIDITNMLSKMVEDDNAVWVCSKSAQGELMSLTNGTNLIYYQNANEGGIPMLMGRPVFFTGKTGKALGSEGDLALVDFSNYLLGSPGEVELAYSDHYKFFNSQTAFRFTARHDGQNLLNAPIVLDDGSTTVSNVVLLA